jgi:acyl carrier protein
MDIAEEVARAEDAQPGLFERTANQVREAIAEQMGAPIEMVTDDAKLTTLGADELDRMELAIDLEHLLSIRIEDDDAWCKLPTVKDVVLLVCGLVVQAAAPKQHGVPA